jgi:hypothetical protein
MEQYRHSLHKPFWCGQGQFPFFFNFSGRVSPRAYELLTFVLVACFLFTVKLIISHVLHLASAVLMGYCAHCHRGGRVIAFLLVSRSLWNVGRVLRDDMTSNHRRRQCLQTPSGESEMSVNFALLYFHSNCSVCRFLCASLLTLRFI